MKKFAVMGFPIKHSLSPTIHALFAIQAQISLSYVHWLVQPNQLEEAIAQFQSQGGRGVNVTMPFKLQALRCVDELAGRAAEAGVVNTITLYASGARLGDTTDGEGLVRDIVSNLKYQIKNKRILVLGAGGAVQGILGALLRAHPALVVIANRSFCKALSLAEHFSSIGLIQADSWEALTENGFDIVINGTSTSLTQQDLTLPSITLRSGALCYDMAYGHVISPFQQWARSQNARHADGLGMLVEQAAESFLIWHGVQPATQRVLARLNRGA